MDCTCAPRNLAFLSFAESDVLGYIDEQSALAYGSTQFKVNFAQLREVYKEGDWARKNILIAVAGAADDGTSGIRQAADSARLARDLACDSEPLKIRLVSRRQALARDIALLCASLLQTFGHAAFKHEQQSFRWRLREDLDLIRWVISRDAVGLLESKEIVACVRRCPG